MKIYIDSCPVEAKEGQTILEAALDANIYIPHLCTHPSLPVIGECGLCVAEVDGRVVKTCETLAEEGMSVNLKTEKVIHQRNVALEFLLAGHPHDCSSCKAYLKCELQAIIQYTDVTHSRLRTIKKPTNDRNTNNPLILREMERCIMCGRCVRACKDLRGVGILNYNREGKITYIGTEGDVSLAEAGCRFCGACVEVCPTGALQDVEGVFRSDIARAQALIPCSVECPAHVDIPAYIRAIKEGNTEQAMAILHEKVPFPFVLGHICNHKCELGCKRNGLNEPIAIRNLKRFATVNASNEKWMEKVTFKPRSGKKVAVVGGGPCGLTAAYYLNKQGHDVDVFEKRPQLGGPMTSGIPAYRLPIEGVKKEIQTILDSGVRAECNTEVSDVHSLKERYDAVLVAVGVSHGKKLRIPGSEYKQVFTAIDVLADLRQGSDISYLGQKVTVIGAGSVGYDVARSLVRKGLQVNIACIEQQDKILADKEDQEEAAEEGVVLFAGRSFEEIEGGVEGVTGLRVHTVLSSTYDRATGTVTEVALEDSQMVISCDSVIFATGQHTGLNDFENFGIEINRFGYPVVEGFKTSEDGIFAAGDAITGISFVINAIAQGRDAAAEIDRYLGGSGEIDEKLCDRTADPVIGTMEGFAELPRVEQVLRGAERVQDEEDVYLTYTLEQAQNEANRCLQCDLRNDIGHVCPWMDYTTK